MTKTVGMICVFALCSLILAACNGVVRLGPVGGPGGNDFEDGKQGPTIAPHTRLSGIAINPSSCPVLDPPARVIRHIQNQYTDPAGRRFLGEKHGSDETTCFYVPGLPRPLEQGEFVTGIYGRAGSFIDSISIMTTKSTIGPIGGSGGDPFFLQAPAGYKIRKFFGRSAAVLDAIGIIAEEEPALKNYVGPPWYRLGAAGGWDGAAFEDPPVGFGIRVSKIVVAQSCVVNFVQFEYSNGQRPVRHGGYGLTSECPTGGYIIAPQTFTLASDEFIKGIRGNAGKVIDQIEFVTNKRTIGPFGEAGGHPFNLMAADGYQVRRLFGRSGAVLDAVGIVAERR